MLPLLINFFTAERKKITAERQNFTAERQNFTAGRKACPDELFAQLL